MGKHLFIVITHQGNIRKLLNRRVKFITSLFTHARVLAHGGEGGGREQLNLNPVKKDLHIEEVSEGGGRALPEVLPAEVVLLRSLHSKSPIQTSSVEFKLKQHSLIFILQTENKFSFKRLEPSI